MRNTYPSPEEPSRGGCVPRVARTVGIVVCLPAVFGAIAYAEADVDHNIDGAMAYMSRPYRAGAGWLSNKYSAANDNVPGDDRAAAGDAGRPSATSTSATETPALIIIEPSASSTTSTTPTETATSQPEDCRANLTELSNSTLIKFVTAWPVNGDGTSYFGDLSPTETIEFFRANKLGGLLISSKITNPEAIKSITKPDNYINDPIVMIDDEGKSVTRLPESVGSYFPNADEMGKMPLNKVKAIAIERAKILRSYNVDAALAPLTDLLPQNGEKSGIEAFRVFADNPDDVATYAGAYAGGLKKGGVNPVYKHFLGGSQITKAGQNSDDAGGSHSDKDKAYSAGIETLKNWDLKVFQGDNAKKLSLNEPWAGVMMGNQIPEDGYTDNKPASVTPQMYELAKENGVSGFMTTDDLGAPGVKQPLSQSFVEAWTAGATLPIFVQNVVDPDKTAQQQLDSIVKRAIKAIEDNVLTKDMLANAIAANASFAGQDLCVVADNLAK